MKSNSVYNNTKRSGEVVVAMVLVINSVIGRFS